MSVENRRNVIAGFYAPSAGRVVFQGHDITGRKPHEVTALGIARTFQNIRLFSNMSARDNVLVGMHSRLKATALGAVDSMMKPIEFDRLLQAVTNYC